LLVNLLKPGNVFRDWLVDTLADKIKNKNCGGVVYKITPASHTVCRFVFHGENYSVIGKFFSEAIGVHRNYDAEKAMKNEFQKLKEVGKIVNVPKPIAINKKFNCVLITEYIPGETLVKFLSNEKSLYEKLTYVANLLKKLHQNTLSKYNKVREFANFHKVLDGLKLNYPLGEKFNHLLGKWWESELLEQKKGCMIHRDAIPPHYLFDNDKIYALDFESSWKNANFIHDLGILCAELKHFFKLNKKSAQKAEPYIGHFLWYYSKNEGEFDRITKVLPFFMGLGLLRISRLDWSFSYKKYLIKEGLRCLETIE